MNKPIVWLSRHPPLPIQREELKRIYGEETQIIHISQVFRDALEILRQLRDMQVERIVVVAPLSMISILLEQGKEFTWIRAEMITLHICKENHCESFNKKTDIWLRLSNNIKMGRHIRFYEFKKIVEVRIIYSPLV